MPAELHPLLTTDMLGSALPDRVQLSIFADHPRIMRRKDYILRTRNAETYFSHRPGAVRHDGRKDPLGLHYAWREGTATLKLGIGPRSFSMAAIFNVQRDLAERAGIAKAQDRHGNCVFPLTSHGYTLPDLRRGLCADIAGKASWARSLYTEIVPAALGLSVAGAVYANFSQIELAYDLPPQDRLTLRSFHRPFGKVFVSEKGAKQGFLSGKLRQGERFVIYAKPDAIRFECALSGARVKEIVGNKRVPDDGAGVERTLTALEERYLPIWVEVERHRLHSKKALLGEFVARLPRIRNRSALDRVAEALDQDGKLATSQHNRVVVEALRRRGLLENLLTKTRLRGYRTAAPGYDGVWSAWRTEL